MFFVKLTFQTSDLQEVLCFAPMCIAEGVFICDVDTRDQKLGLFRRAFASSAEIMCLSITFGLVLGKRVIPAATKVRSQYSLFRKRSRPVFACYSPA